jgi:hypothetical protein
LECEDLLVERLKICEYLGFVGEFGEGLGLHVWGLKLLDAQASLSCYFLMDCRQLVLEEFQLF